MVIQSSCLWASCNHLQPCLVRGRERIDTIKWRIDENFTLNTQPGEQRLDFPALDTPNEGSVPQLAAHPNAPLTSEHVGSPVTGSAGPRALPRGIQQVGTSCRPQPDGDNLQQAFVVCRGQFTTPEETLTARQLLEQELEANIKETGSFSNFSAALFARNWFRTKHRSPHNLIAGF